MSQEEELCSLRKPYESDYAWFARKAFLEAHWGDFSREQLECLSQLFINVNMIGCEYSPSLNAKIQQLGAGLLEKARVLQEEHEMSRPAEKSPVVSVAPEKVRAVKEIELKKEVVNEPAAVEGERWRQLKLHLTQALKTNDSKAAVLLEDTCERLRFRFSISTIGQCTELRIDNLLALKQTFVDPAISRELASSAVLESLVACDATVAEDQILFDMSEPKDCYRNFILRKLEIAQDMESVQSLQGLTEALSEHGLKLTHLVTHLQGWSQRVDICVEDVVVASRIVTKGECVKARLDAIIDQMCTSICHSIQNGSLRENGTQDI